MCLLIYRAGGRIAHRGGGQGRQGRRSGWRDAVASAAAGATADEIRHVAQPAAFFCFNNLP